MSDQSEFPPSSSRSSVHVTEAAASHTTSAGVTWERAVLEKLAFSAIREQRAARRWKIFFRFIGLFFVVTLAWRLFAMPGERVVAGATHTALVALEGEIASGTQASAENIIPALEKAFANPHAEGVILKIDSPGGSPVQSGRINGAIRRLRAKYPKKLLYVVVGDICASGGYYIAVAADKIFVDKASIIGSIGVRMDNFGVTELIKKLGVERRLLTSGVNKGFYDPFLPEVPVQKRHALHMLGQIHQQFIDTVRQGRGKRLKETPEIFSGLFWTGQESIRLGLADGLGDADFVAREILKAPKIVSYTQKEGVIDRLAHKFGLTVRAIVRTASTGSGLQLMSDL
jgi:protease-4